TVPPSAPAPAPPDQSEATAAAIAQLIPLLQAAERADLVERCTAAAAPLRPPPQGAGRADLPDRAPAPAARLRRPSTIVCVVGEFKQGKSSLVNGLLGRAVCPVDDDPATTAIPLIRHGDPPKAIVRRRDDSGQAVSEAVEIEDLVQWVSESG